MSVIDGFLSTWKLAHATFGEGPLADGSQFDQGERLHGLRADVDSASPASSWTGVAADSYADANARHSSTLGNLAHLDGKLGAEVGRSAEVVAAGRRDLEAVRKVVVDAAATVPNTAAGQRRLWPLISKGSTDIRDIITRSQADLSAIAKRIRGLGGEYQALDDGEGEGGKAGQKLDKLPMTPDTTLDLDDIVYLDPNALGPSHSVEIGPGTWVPKNDFPGVSPSPPKAPLDYRDIVVLPPGTKGKSWQKELVPGSGAWVPDPNAPGFVQHQPEVPVDMATAAILDEGQRVPAGLIEIYPGARIAIPDPNFGAPR